ncbi:hypothetical protein B0H11DRAFT_1926304 [Mycena galericulata]|nr:hypothetical protein B0H11DRAFT_1926304 [Mycena galericulata]
MSGFQRAFLAKRLAESAQGRAWRQGLHPAPQKRVWERLLEKKPGERASESPNSDRPPDWALALKKTSPQVASRNMLANASGCKAPVQGLKIASQNASQSKGLTARFSLNKRNKSFTRGSLRMRLKTRSHAEGLKERLAKGPGVTVREIRMNKLAESARGRVLQQFLRIGLKERVLRRVSEQRRERQKNRKVLIGNRRSTELRIVANSRRAQGAPVRGVRIGIQASGRDGKSGSLRRDGRNEVNGWDYKTGQRPVISATEREREMGGRRELGGRARRAESGGSAS